MPISPARTAAFDVLRAVEEGAFASDLLLERAQGLEARDAALASEIVFGVLRRRAQLDWLVERQTGRGIARLDAEVRIALRMGVYQVRHLDRVPAHAAVTESVELVKRARKRSAAGLVNAVLRKIPPATAETAWPDRATALSLPAWMLARWDRQFGVEAAERMGTAFLSAPPVYVRAPLPEGAGFGARELLGGEAMPVGARHQDIGSQSVVPLLDLAPGMSYLDLCAAPGNKTLQALETALGRAVALDVSPRRARILAGLLAGACPVVVADSTRGLPFKERQFDRILVDAPCSGTGTLARNPEIRWRLRPEDLAEHQARQKALLRNALAQAAGPGARVVYSTCSLEPEENQQVVEAIAAESPEWQVVERLERLPGREPGDGFFGVALERRRPAS